jgi:hypothetical protein
MKKKFFTLLALTLFAGTSFATPITLKVGTYGDGPDGVNNFTGIFNQMQFFANTTTTQFGNPELGPLPQVGDRFVDAGNLDITSFLGLVGSDQGLGYENQTDQAYALTATWNDIGGYINGSALVGTTNIQTTTYDQGSFNFYIDSEINQNYEDTVFSGDDTGFGADATAELIAQLELVSGTGTNSFDLDGNFRSGSSKIRAKFTMMKEDFWFDGSTVPPVDMYDTYFLELGWDIFGNVDQNTDNLKIDNVMDDGVLFHIGSDHDGSIDFEVVPEPSTIILLGAGLLGTGVMLRRKNRK